MKNFEYVEEQKLIQKIWNIHDKIFNMPYKNFIFCGIEHAYEMSSAILPGYTNYSFEQYVDCPYLNNKRVTYLSINQDKEVNLKFGDILICIYILREKNLKNHIEFNYIDKSIYKNLPNHKSIVCKVDFLYFRQFIITYREAMLEYHKRKEKHLNLKSPLDVTQLTSLEKVIAEMNKH